MTPKEAFALALRILGGWTILQAIYNFTYAFDVALGVYHPLHVTIQSFLVTSVIFLLSGIYFLRGAPHIVTFAYPTNGDQE